MSFCHLHCHDCFSLLDGLGTPKQYCEKAKKEGFEYLAVTNHGNTDGAIQLQKEASDAGIIPIFGAELYVVEDITIKEKGEKRKHLTVLVKNETGWKNLNKMLSEAHLEGFYRRPRVSPKVILSNCEGLVFMSACSSSIITCDWGIKLAYDLADICKDDFYLEVMPHDYKDQKEVNNLCVSLSKKTGAKLIATNDCHYVNSNDTKSHEVLLAIQSKKRWKDPDRWRFSVDGLYVRTEKEMAFTFSRQGVLSRRQYNDAIQTTIEAAEKCKDFKIAALAVDLPIVDYSRVSDGDEDEAMRVICRKGLKEKILDNPKKSHMAAEYRKRLKEELLVITKQGFVRYFLIVWELMDWCRKNNIMVGPGRGSSGGSLVCWLMNITAVDPIEHGLLFARFISPARIDLPDIDMDFEDCKRDKIWQHFKEIYGEKNVAGVSTFSDMKGRGALRDVSRVFDLPLVDVNAASKCIVVRSGGDFRSSFTLEDAFASFEDGRKFKAKYPEETRIAMSLEGQKRSRGQHAAAICISAADLTDGKRGYLLRGNKGELVINWEKFDIEHVGLMKLDVLGLNALTILQQTRELVNLHKGIDIDFESLPIDDKNIYDEFNQGNTVGIFQFGSLGLRKVCKEIGIEDFKMLTHVNALFRPGTLRSGMVTQFQLRKYGEVEWKHKHPFMAEITGETFGIILYQEQLMRFMYDLGGLGWKTADTVRKVISKSQGVEQFMKFKKQFADGCVERKTLDRKTAEELWDELASFGCLSGDTVIYRCSSNQHAKRELTIKEAFDYQTNTNFKHRKLKVLAMDKDNRIRYNTINRIVYTGEKELFRITTKSGKSIKASAEHRFLINGKWKRISESSVGDLIRVTDLKRPKKRYITTGTGSGAHNHDGSLYTYEEQRQIEKLKKKHKNKCQDCGSSKHIEMHHFDGDHRNNSDKNTMLLCRKCHHSSKYHSGNIFKRFTTGLETFDDTILSIKSVGTHPCYDIEMVDNPRNFVANCVISHNSYGFNKSHAVEYSLIAYWQMYCKIYHPSEYLCACLTYGSDEKKEDLVEEATRLGLDVRPPKIGKSRAQEWVADKNVLYCPLLEIKGIGETTAQKLDQALMENSTPAEVPIIKRRRGFMKKPEVKKPAKISEKFLNILKDINAYEDVSPSEEEAERISSYFTFSFCKDSLRYFKDITEKLSQSIKLTKMEEIDFGVIEKESSFYFGQMTQIKFGYRGKIDTLEKRLGVSGTADSLGGVYGNLKDDTDFAMIVFGSDIYGRKKDLTEHCTGEYILAKANHPNRTTSIHCVDAWFQEEVLSCKLGGLGLDLIRNRRFREPDDYNVKACDSCELRGECRSPVPPSKGTRNIMIVGEAPGREEDAQGKGFVGESGNMIWDSLKKYRLSREMFHVTNVVKCLPSKTKTPTKKHIKECGRFLKAEINSLQPVLVLAFGNTCMEYFKGQDKGIMDMSGKTEWSKKEKCWVCYCIHPASVLYHRENEKMFLEGLKNFYDCIKVLGEKNK